MKKIISVVLVIIIICTSCAAFAKVGKMYHVTVVHNDQTDKIEADDYTFKAFNKKYLDTDYGDENTYIGGIMSVAIIASGIFEETKDFLVRVDDNEDVNKAKDTFAIISSYIAKEQRTLLMVSTGGLFADVDEELVTELVNVVVGDERLVIRDGVIPHTSGDGAMYTYYIYY